MMYHFTAQVFDTKTQAFIPQSTFQFELDNSLGLGSAIKHSYSVPGGNHGSKEFFTACVQAWLARLPFTGDLRAIVLECTPTTLKCDIPPRDVVRDIREVFERNFTALASARFFDAVRRADISNESWMDECRFYLKGDLYHLGYLACLELEVGRVLDHTSEEFRQNILEAEEARGWNP